MKLELNEQTLNAYIKEAIRQELCELNEGGKAANPGKLRKLGRFLAKHFKKMAGKGEIKPKLPKASNEVIYGAQGAEKAMARNGGKMSDDWAVHDVFRGGGEDVHPQTNKPKPNDRTNIKDNLEWNARKSARADEILKQISDEGDWDKNRRAAVTAQKQYLDAQQQELQRQLAASKRQQWGAIGTTAAAGGAAAAGANALGPKTAKKGTATNPETGGFTRPNRERK